LGTRELLDQKFMLADSRQNILDIPARHLNFKYLVAEWLWVQFGHSDLASLVQYNSQMKRFSDDGIYLTGAYGPHIGGGWNRCVEKLRKDPASRQGVIQIPRPQIETIDEPCTLSLQFIIRSSALHCLATMRSSDMWLGMPYDVFTFTQIQNVMAGELGVGRGTFVLNAGSSHIYESDVPKILAVVNAVEARTQHTRDLPGRPPAWLDDVFVTQSREPIPSSVDRHNDPWVRFANVLTSPNWSTALYELSTSGSFMRPPNDPRVTFTAFDLESPSEPESHV
jgi:thymidylate synthase